MQPAPPSETRLSLHQLLRAMIEKGASDLHITTGCPPQLRIDGALVPLRHAAARAGRDQAALLHGPHRGAEDRVREEERARSLVRREEPLALPREHLHAARRRRGRLPRHPVQDPHVRRARAAPGDRGARVAPARPHPRYGPDGLGQVDDARVHHRQDQHGDAPAHRHDRRSDRVPAPAQALRREPARGRHRHAARSRTRSSTCCARIPTWCSSARCATSRRSRRR